MARAIFAIVSILLAGCATPATETTTSTTTSEILSSSTTTSSQSNVSVPDNSIEMIWEGCHAAGTSFRWTNGEGPQGRNPPGWTNQTEDINNQWFLDLILCEKFSVGSFERGPIAMGMEYHNQFTAPAKCKEGPRYDQASVLQWLYIDDAELAEFLSTEIGMPAIFAQINETISSTGPVQENTWSLSVGHNRSFISARTYGPPLDPLPWKERLFWAQEEELWQLDLAEQLYSPAMAGNAGAGEMHPPTLYGTWRPGTYASVISIYSTYEIESTLRHYEDLACERLS